MLHSMYQIIPYTLTYKRKQSHKQLNVTRLRQSQFFKNRPKIVAKELSLPFPENPHFFQHSRGMLKKKNGAANIFPLNPYKRMYRSVPRSVVSARLLHFKSSYTLHNFYYSLFIPTLCRLCNSNKIKKNNNVATVGLVIESAPCTGKKVWHLTKLCNLNYRISNLKII